MNSKQFNELATAYYDLFETGNEHELQYIVDGVNKNDNKEGFIIYYWAKRKVFVKAYGTYGVGFTDYCNLEFIPIAEEV